MTIVDTTKSDAKNKEAVDRMNKGKDDKQKEMDKVLDGERFSQNIKRITGRKKSLQTASSLRNKSSDRVIKMGIVSPEEIINSNQNLSDKEMEKKLAETELSEATGFKVTNFERLSKEDIKFINDLPDDGTKDIVIRELFGTKILNKYKKWLVTNKNKIISKNQEIDYHSDESAKFVELYIENYNHILEGNDGTPLNKLAAEAGFEKVNTTQIMANPWVASKIELYHKSVEKMNDYHYQQIQDRKLREKQRAQDLKDRMLNQYAANPTMLTDGKLGDQARMLKTLDDLQKDKNGQNTAPAVAIQINSDTNFRFQCVALKQTLLLFRMMRRNNT